MPKFAGHLLGVTPSGAVANWILETQASRMSNIQEVSWGGEVTTSTAMRTRIARDSAIGTGTRTAGSTQSLNPNSAATAAFFSTTYASSQPTISAGALFGTSWNAHGGVVRWLAAPGEEFILVGSQSIECRADVGTATSSYGVVWEDN
jgi:hypothetical protein